ncbi:MAG: hypothetical protein ACD_15C00104G0005 [uncultured bacterium]|nr:MAG: hypothetical protein ACD_15C00104G0005 [uncultured bacterium]
MKKYSWKFWAIFWASAAVLLVSFYFFLQPSRQSDSPEKENKLSMGKKYSIISGVVEYLLSGEREKTFLILFQNNMEIRPGGGFIGSFGILKINKGAVSDLQIHDTGYFDERIPDSIKAPYPMEENLRVKYLKMRDSNFSPDFPTNAKMAEDFYYLGKGEEKFDGVAAITTNVLTSFLKVTGPVQLEGYPGTYTDDQAVLALEYQVEKAFDEQGIARRERKSVMNLLAKEIIKKSKNLSFQEKLLLFDVILDDLSKKDIQLNFKDQKMQKIIKDSGWDGGLDTEWEKDYLMTVDANLGAWKSDYYVKRDLEYFIDLSQEVPKIKVRINYNHTALQRDYMTKDYFSYLRIYLPEGAWLLNKGDFPDIRFGKEKLIDGKERKYFGTIVRFPINSKKTIEFDYILPEKIAEDYVLKIQKQAGINDEPVRIYFTGQNGEKKEYSGILDSDLVWK